MSLIKDIYNRAFFERFANSAAVALPAFDKEKFIQQIFDRDFAGKEWKERMKHITGVLHHFLPADFATAAHRIEQLIIQLRKDHFTDDSLPFMFLPDYIETYGINHLKPSVKAFTFITQFISCEFAVRPFLLRYEQPMMDQMYQWSLHKNSKVRRLASEGSRPRLPWAMALPALKKDPSAIIPILENLKNDPSELVRRSVANNLNDIAKDNPDTVIAIAEQWMGSGTLTDAIIKHGCRTLLKQGNARILKLYGLQSERIDLEDFRVKTPVVATGAHLEFSFRIRNNNPHQQMIRLEYGLYYKKAKGHLARKVFKISERLYQPGEVVTLQRKQSFRLITTRKFHYGGHQLSIIINGNEQERKDFELTEALEG